MKSYLNEKFYDLLFEYKFSLRGRLLSFYAFGNEL